MSFNNIGVDINNIITIVLGAIAGWFFTRKKSNAETKSAEFDAKSAEIESMNALKDYYRDEILNLTTVAEKNREEIKRLNEIIIILESIGCERKNCNKRIRTKSTGRITSKENIST